MPAGNDGFMEHPGDVLQEERNSRDQLKTKMNVVVFSKKRIIKARQKKSWTFARKW